MFKIYLSGCLITIDTYDMYFCSIFVGVFSILTMQILSIYSKNLIGLVFSYLQKLKWQSSFFVNI